MENKGFLFLVVIVLVGGLSLLLYQQSLPKKKQDKVKEGETPPSSSVSAKLNAESLIDQIQSNYMLSLASGKEPVMEGEATSIQLPAGNIKSGHYKIELNEKNQIIIRLIDVVIGNTTCNGTDLEGIVCK